MKFLIQIAATGVVLIAWILITLLLIPIMNWDTWNEPWDLLMQQIWPED